MMISQLEGQKALFKAKKTNEILGYKKGKVYEFTTNEYGNWEAEILKGNLLTYSPHLIKTVFEKVQEVG